MTAYPPCTHEQDQPFGPSLWLDKDGAPLCLQCWSVRRKDERYLRVAITKLTMGSTSEVEISTVWLGIDQNFTGNGLPILFETMIFGGALNEWQERYATEDEARMGHEYAVNLVLEHKHGHTHVSVAAITAHVTKEIE